MELLKIINDFASQKKAVGHFNISNFEILKGIALAGKDLNTPLLIGASEGERKYLGSKTAIEMTKALAKDLGVNLFMSADHVKSFDSAKEVIDLGYDAIVVDGSKLPISGNIEFTKSVVEYAKSIDSQIIIEGEIGFIGESSKILDDIPIGLDDLTKVSEAEDFIRQTDVKVLSPSIGNIHGVLKNRKNPKIDIDRVKEIKQATGIFLTLHGASGIENEEIKASITAGINIVHFNTDLRVIYKNSLKDNLDNSEIAPYKYLVPVIDSVKEVVEEKIKILNN